ncbi:hypothetical protein [Allorhizocola rhizosphaerae]|uniref:hypothetical protein n=1 Tax=Allorhizocola rhizosphaerae TaxID=1872709 RepID=UPI000E3D9346|nr:hypothetical protein [Allorhizocola rhizosphaerae]
MREVLPEGVGLMDAAIGEAKQAARERVLGTPGSGRRGARAGRARPHPNFVGAERAAQRLAELDVWQP